MAYIPKDSLTAGTVQKYKFFVENNGGIDWEGSVNPNDPDGNRTFVYSENLVMTAGDTTLKWVYFNNQVPTGKTLVNADVTFRVSTEALEALGLFDRGVGDEIKVIGAKGWDRPNDFIDMNFNPILQEWTAVEPFTNIPGTNIPYKYFVVWDSSRVDPNSPNFIPMLNLDNGWEEPSVEGGGNRIFTYGDQAQQSPPGDFGFERQFFNSVPANGWFANDIAVTFNIDMAPAMDPATNPETLFNPATDSVFVQMDNSLLAVAQGFEAAGEGARVVKLTDPDGDMVYSGTWNITGPGWYQLGYIIAYGNTNTGFITNGGGFDRGRRYYQFIHPTNVADDGSTTWPSEFNLPMLTWKRNNLDVEQPPDLTKPTSVTNNGGDVPVTFALAQNYPNPFNPETTIQYKVAQTAKVQIKVYNLAGQLVKTLVDKKQSAGTYTVKWNGDNNNGRLVSTGIYFLKMKAGDFRQVRKMALVR
ncbi:MAG: T9SS C-terminal target domain-containing protein [Calditrichaeota bacterium]|nr:MAG: T9SS C-terminal target domain-containing protein [Calditrichota bacterium]